MSHEERTYWPSNATREELRSQGDIAYSFLVAQCVATIGAAVAATLTAREFSEALHAYKVQVENSSTDFAPLLEILQRGIVIPALGIALAVFCAGLVQTRFWIGTARLGLDPSRVAPKLTPLSPGHILKRIVRQFVAVVVLTGGSIAGTAWVAKDAFPLLNAGQADVLPWLAKIAEGVAIVGGIGMALLMVFGFIASRLLFNLAHRLTKREAEQESREFGG